MGEIHEKPDLPDFCYCYWLKYQGLHDNVLMFCVFFYWAWIKLKNAPLVLVGVTSKDHWDHLNQNPRLKALEFVASKSRKVMPAQEENEDRFYPAGWTKIGVKMMKALVKWKKQVHVGCFCLFFMNESSINSIQFPSIFPVSMFSSQKECRFIDPILFASLCYLHIYIYTYISLPFVASF